MSPVSDDSVCVRRYVTQGRHETGSQPLESFKNYVIQHESICHRRHHPIKNDRSDVDPYPPRPLDNGGCVKRVESLFIPQA